MSLQHAKLAPIQYVPQSAASLYANPAATKTYVKGLILFNGHTTPEIVDLYIVPPSGGGLGVADATNQIGKIEIEPGATVFFPLAVEGMPIVLDAEQESIQAGATSASTVTALVIGDRE